MKIKKKTGLKRSAHCLYIIPFFIIFCLIISGCSSSQITHEQAKVISGNLKDRSITPQSALYTIQPGDVIKITVAEYPEFDTTVTVSSSGSILLKVVGEFQVKGLTRNQFTGQLAQKLSEYVITSVHPLVTIENPLIQKVSVLGAVARQDNYSINSDMSLLQVLALAGGTSSEADVQHIRIIRGGDPQNTAEVDLTQYLEGNRSFEIPMIKADYVTI
jgi:polysaccharide export outer membrane protein